MVTGLCAQSARSGLVYSTYLGGESADVATAVATDAQGNVYVAGNTDSASFPVTPGAFQTRQAGVPSQYFMIGVGQVTDAFVSKFDAKGNLVYSTYLGGSGTDVANAIAVDGQGNAYVAGSTTSSDFPVTSGAFQKSAAFLVNGLSQSHAFVAKLNPAGTALVYCTFLAGSGSDSAQAIAVDAAGNAYVTGQTSALDFPVTAGALEKTVPPATNLLFPISHGFVAKLNPAGSGLVYATYLSGANGSSPQALALGGAGDVVVAGYTGSADFPVTAGATQTSFSGQPGFVSRLDAAGATLLYSTFLGKDGATEPAAISMDAAGAVYVTGTTSSKDFPVTAGALETQLPGDLAGFVVKLNPTGTALQYATLLGGNVTRPYAIAADAAGNAWIAGETGDASIPLTADAYQSGYTAAPCAYSVSSMFVTTPISVNCGDAFLAELDAAGATLKYSTLFGGNGYDQASALALGADGSVYVAGSTQSGNLPATAGALATHRATGGDCTDWSSPSAQLTYPCDDAFLARFNRGTVPVLRPFEVVNAASLLPGAVAPGELVSLLGSGIGPAAAADLTLTASGTVSTTLAGVQVLFDGVPVPLIHVEATRITLVVPFGTAAKQQIQVTIATNGVPGPSQTIQIAVLDPSEAPAAAPAVFTTTGGSGQAACINQDGTLNGAGNPAAVGSEVALYLTGLGPTVPQSLDGAVNDPSALPSAQANVMVYVGGKAARVLYAGAAPDLVAGVMQVNFAVPAVTGMAAVFVAAGDVVSSQAGVSIWVK